MAPTSVIPGLPSSVQVVVEVFNTLTGPKIEPAAPVPSIATTFSWLAAHGVGPGWLEVVVVEEVPVVEVVASVVEVDVVVGAVVVVVAVVV